MQQLFPAEGEREPKRRFKAFSGEWEEKKLGDITTYHNGKAHEQDIKEIGEYIVVNSKFISTIALPFGTSLSTINISFFCAIQKAVSVYFFTFPLVEINFELTSHLLTLS
jgi:restriction endonuclease S subunit